MFNVRDEIVKTEGPAVILGVTEHLRDYCRVESQQEGAAPVWERLSRQLTVVINVMTMAVNDHRNGNNLL